MEAAMAKYEPLTEFLKSKGGREIRLRFDEIERIIGEKLPEKSKRHRAWWSNNPSNSVMTKAWLDAGYKSAQVDIAGERVSFVAAHAAEGFGEMKQAKFDHKVPTQSPQTSEVKPYRHPAFGVWKGKVTLLPDYDYTQPADPEWGRVYEE
jgi:hypothetical protein